jgi:hypothetical protein
MASTVRSSKTNLKVGKKRVIRMDRDDNQANWRELMWKEAWKGVYIPEDLRKKYKIKYDAKNNVITIKERKKKK